MSVETAQYAYIALAAIGFFLFMTMMILSANRKRRVRNLAPIRGTAWMQLPSYNQSQRAANRGDIEQNLPAYTANPNPEQDLGYYDQNQRFHLYTQATDVASKDEDENETERLGNLRYPEPAHHADGDRNDMNLRPNSRTAPPYTQPQV